MLASVATTALALLAAAQGADAAMHRCAPLPLPRWRGLGTASCSLPEGRTLTSDALDPLAG